MSRSDRHETNQLSILHIMHSMMQSLERQTGRMQCCTFELRGGKVMYSVVYLSTPVIVAYAW